MPYPETILIICPTCSTEVEVHKDKEKEEHSCPKCSGEFVPERFNEPDPRHLC